MKHFFKLFIVCSAALVMLPGCKEKIDLKDVDTTVSVDLGLAAPIGTVYATIGDLLGIKEVQNYVEVDEDGILHIMHDTIIKRNFRNVDITSYPADTLKKCNFAEGFKVNEVWPGDQYIVEYPITVDFDNVNKNPTDERIDSVSVLSADYTSIITISNDLSAQGFKWDWIKRIDVILKDAFWRKEGNTITVYDKKKDSSITDFGQPIKITLDNFMLYFMQDRTIDPSAANALKSAELSIKYYVSVPWTANKITIDPAQSTINYNLQLKMLTFDAIWGFAKPSSQMRETDTITIANSWPMWKDIKQAKLPLSEPKIDLYVKTKVAGKLQLNADYFYAVADENLSDTVYATFRGEDGVDRIQKKYFWTHEAGIDYIDIKKQTIGDSIQHHLTFSKDVKEGAIDRLFKVRPDRVGYKFYVEVYDIEPKRYPQIRLGPQNYFNVDAHIDLPLVFDKDLGLQYADTLKDVDLSAVSLDSLLNGVLAKKDVQDANLVLYMDIYNHIPLGISATVKFLDDKGQEILLDGKPLRFIKYGDNAETAYSDTLNLSMPEMKEINRKHGDPVNIAKDTQKPDQYIIDINKDNFDAVSKVKTIAYNVTMHNNGEKALYPAAITKDARVLIKAGVTARVNGKLDLRQLMDPKKENN